MENGAHIFDRSCCSLCGACADVCIGNALSISGRVRTAEDVFDEVRKDSTYYRESGGGVTVSGGEPILHRAFVRELFSLCREAGIGTAVETNLDYPYEYLSGIREQTGLFLADWKESDPERHKAYTGRDNKRIEENLRALDRDGHAVRLRCPIIPGLNDREDHFQKIAALTRELANITGAELLPYHRLGLGKIRRFGLEDKIPFEESREPEVAEVDRWYEICRSYGGRMFRQE